MPKVLIIAYYWPPAGGPGVQRWLSFTRYLPEFEIEPVMFIPENPNYPIIDESLLAYIPQNLVCYRQKIKEPYFLARLLIGKKAKMISAGIIKERSATVLERALIWIRGNWFIPDARKYWVSPSVKRILKIIKEENIRTIITTGPPHSVHLIGLGIKKQENIKWIADFRDPWTSIGYHKKLRLSKRAKKKHKDLEKEVLQGADKIITTSRTTLEEFAAISSKPIVVVTNGYDEKEAESQPQLDDEFSLSFIGSLLSGRNPENLWKALSELAEENPEFRAKLRIRIVGVISEDVLSTIYRHGLKEFTELVPYVAHNEARRYQMKSQLLLLLEIDKQETKGIIPGKLFEYMAAKRPILAIGPKNWEAGMMVEETNSGVFFEYKEFDGLKVQLRDWHKQYTAGSLVECTSSIEQYSRRSLTEKLAAEFTWE
ncbi:MAG: glycosyltransferase family 4 protein [Flavobacteriaceae bacterium]